MSRDQLINEALAAGKAARHNLRVIRRNPEKVLPGLRMHVEGQLLQLIEFEKWQMKNTRRAGRVSVRTRMKDLFMSILPYFRRNVKEEMN